MRLGNAHSLFILLALTAALIGSIFTAVHTEAATEGIDAQVKIGLCGDDFIDTTEDCEPGPPEDLGGASCTTEGFGGGALSCNIDCTFNTSQCSAPPPPPSGSGSGGGGGGGGSTSASSSATAVVFSGRAYPGSTVTILKDAQIVATTEADANANFSFSLSGLTSGNYIFSLYGEDDAGNRSSLLTFPVSVTSGSTVRVGGIFIAPTIDVDKSEVRRGDNLAIFGKSTPGSEVTIEVNSAHEMFVKTTADNTGAYLHNLDTAPLELGNHLAKAKAAHEAEISSFSKSAGFVVGNRNVPKISAARLVGDLNNDGRVNLIDFSILAYWYRRSLGDAGLFADLNSDVRADLIDFSILVANWTG